MILPIEASSTLPAALEAPLHPTFASTKMLNKQKQWRGRHRSERWLLPRPGDAPFDVSLGLASYPLRLVVCRQTHWKTHYAHPLQPKKTFNKAKQLIKTHENECWRQPRLGDASSGPSPLLALPIAVFLSIHIWFYFLSPFWGAAAPKGDATSLAPAPKGPTLLSPPLKVFFFHILAKKYGVANPNAPL